MLLAGLFSIAAPAQNSIEGAVVNDRTGLPLCRADVVLRPTQTGAQNIGVETDDRGSFAIRDVEAGRYSIGAARDGYLSSSVCLIGTLRLPRTFAIGEKQSVAGLTFRLRPFAVMAGRISFDDGEPAMGVRVEAYREYRNRVRHGCAIVGAATTHDRGEYRMFGLAPGSYLVAAAGERTDSRRTCAAIPDHLLSPRDQVRGSVGAPGLWAGRRGHRHISGAGALPAQPTWDRANRFEIRDVTPGQYILGAEGADGGKVLVGPIPITVGACDIDDAQLTIQGDRAGRAVLVQDGNEPRNERAKMVNSPEGDGEFRFMLAEGELYDLCVENLPSDFYGSSVRVNGVDAMPFGVDGNAASLDRPFEMVLDSRSGSVSGRVLGPDDSLWSRASVALISDPPNGVARGRYILVAWLDDAPCDCYDPDGLAACRAVGTTVEVESAKCRIEDEGGKQAVV